MSAGNFIYSKYQADDVADIYRVRIQPETVALQINGIDNAPPPEPVTQKVKARVSGSRRGYGVFTRLVRFKFSDAVPEGYLPNSVITLPILRPGNYADMSEDPNPTGVYLTLPIQVVGFSDEEIN